jgi:hypothetical protein
MERDTHPAILAALAKSNREADPSRPFCPCGCGRKGVICQEGRDGLWALVKARRDIPDGVYRWARLRLGLDD